MDLANLGLEVVGVEYLEHTLASQSGLDHWTSEWMDLRAYPWSALLITWGAVALTNGALKVEASIHPAQAAASVVDLTSSLTTTFGTGFAVGVTAGATTIPVDNAWPYMRWRYVRTAGGAAAQFTPYFFGRKKS